MVSLVGSDGLFFGITFHLCGQAEILKLDLSRFIDESENKAERMNVLTRRHRHLLNLFGKLNSIISSVLIVQLSSSCLLICTTGDSLIILFTLKIDTQ